MLDIQWELQPEELRSNLSDLWQLAPAKLARVNHRFAQETGTPVFTQDGKYVQQGWTEWTRGFQYGVCLLVFDACEHGECLEIGRRCSLEHMPPHVTHFGVHDHGFNIVSTYGNLWRLAREGRFSASSAEIQLCELALRCSGAVQARRWTQIDQEHGFIHSFNGPHSLFCDTIRSLRSLGMAHQLGQWLWTENDCKISLLQRLLQHARTTAQYSVYYGEDRDIYDVSGRVAHESLFNVTSGEYRCPSTQQGYAPFTTWTRGLAWIITGYAEQLEFLAQLDHGEFTSWGGWPQVEAWLLRAARAAADYYLDECASDGIPYWDTGAPGLVQMPDYANQPADPYNAYEPVDSSAAAITCQGLLRLGNYLSATGAEEDGKRYSQAGLTILNRLLQSPYLAKDPEHDGLLLHSVYHRPRGWDYLHPGAAVPHSESSLWGDYHLVEAALSVQRAIDHRSPYHFFDGVFG